MSYCAGLDTSSTKTAICVVATKTGETVFEMTVATEPLAIVEALEPYLERLERIGHEAGSVAPWLHRDFSGLGLPMELLESRHAAMAWKIQRNKTDRNDAYGLAQLVRTGWFRTLRVKSGESHRFRLLLTHRRTLKRKLLDIENEIRQSLKVSGLLVGPRVQRSTFEARVRELTAQDALIGGVTGCMLRAWSTLWREYKRLHDLLIRFVGRDEPCRRSMAIPGVGPVTALSFKAAVDDPRRFAKSKMVGAHFGLTSRRIQSGERQSGASLGRLWRRLARRKTELAPVHPHPMHDHRELSGHRHDRALVPALRRNELLSAKIETSESRRALARRRSRKGQRAAGLIGPLTQDSALVN